MKYFDKLKFEAHQASSMGGLATAFFPNGYGVSVIFGDMFYSDGAGSYELAVLEGVKDACDLTYDTPITDDVIGWQSAKQINALMADVAALPKRAAS